MIASQGVPRIGIVVIGRNEGERLARALRSVDPGTNTVVYVDSGSSDGSLMLAEQLGAQVASLDLSRPFSAGRARNLGFSVALQGGRELEFVQFIDGDCELDHRWIAEASAFLTAHPDLAVVCGRRRERFPDRSPYNKLCDMEWNTPVGEALASGGDFLVRTKAFQDVGGFADHMIAGEEPEMCARLRAAGWKIWRIDAEMTLHDANILRWTQWWRRCVRSGYAHAAIARLHGNGPDKLKKRETLSVIVWGGLLPAFILGASIFNPIFLGAFLLYPAQILRLTLKAPERDGALLFATSVVLGKFAEFVGVCKFAAARLAGRHDTLIEYK